MFDSPLLAPLGLRHARYLVAVGRAEGPQPAAPSSTPGWRGSSGRGMRAADRLRPLPALAQVGQDAPPPEASRASPAPSAASASATPDVRRLDRVERGQPPRLAHRPRGRGARRQYFDALARECPGCRIVAADMLDTSGMAAWIPPSAGTRGTGRGSGACTTTSTPTDTVQGTRTLLRYRGRGQVWFTETGGIVLRREYQGRKIATEFRYGQPTRSGRRATRIRLACLSRRCGACTSTTGRRRSRSPTGTPRSSARAAAPPRLPPAAAPRPAQRAVVRCG